MTPPVNFTIRRAAPSDAEPLSKLYTCHLSQAPADSEQDISRFRELLAKFAADPCYHLLVGETEGEVVSSVTLVVVENLTHGARPYAVMENVVTRSDCRGRGYATALIARAKEIAAGAGCYKIMLLTGSKREETLRFYENCGFDSHVKTAFLMKL